MIIVSIFAQSLFNHSFNCDKERKVQNFISVMHRLLTFA